MKNKNEKSILNTVWDFILEQLKGRAVKLALKKILESAAAGGFKAWLISFVVKNLWNEFVEPLMNAALIEVKYIKGKIDGKITADKIEKARRSGDANAYNDAVDSAFD